MSYRAADGRQQILDELARAADEIALALASLGEAYEHLDDDTAERLEEQLFLPVRSAYGRAKRTHTQFAERHRLAPHAFVMPLYGPRARDARGEIEAAVAAAEDADQTLATLQDSMLPVEVGDAELRAGLAEVRRLLDVLPARGRELVRTVGR